MTNEETLQRKTTTWTQHLGLGTLSTKVKTIDPRN